MAIKIVMGPSCSGKSYFIKETFPNSTVVDLYDFQENMNLLSVENILDSYIATKDALIKEIKENKDVVLEHTLLKAIRREIYIKAIKEVTSEPINVYVLLPSLENYLRFSEARHIKNNKDTYDFMMNLLEIPTYEEGFDNIYLITPQLKEEEKQI